MPFSLAAICPKNIRGGGGWIRRWKAPWVGLGLGLAGLPLGLVLRLGLRLPLVLPLMLVLGLGRGLGLALVGLALAPALRLVAGLLLKKWPIRNQHQCSSSI